MTCSQCRYEFCWLCLGDYRNHNAETGRGLCNSFEDVLKIGVRIYFVFIMTLLIENHRSWCVGEDKVRYDAKKTWPL